jgi:hypothetical protein
VNSAGKFSEVGIDPAVDHRDVDAATGRAEILGMDRA